MAGSARPVLHALRNTHGPEWLDTFELPQDFQRREELPVVAAAADEPSEAADPDPDDGATECAVLRELLRETARLLRHRSRMLLLHLQAADMPHVAGHTIASLGVAAQACESMALALAVEGDR